MKRVALFIIACLISLSSIATNRALIIGIGEYKKGTGWRKINGDADVELLAPMFEQQGFDVTMVVNEAATKAGIVNALNDLIAKCEPGDKVYFHFSGHGQPIEDLNDDETTEFDQTMIPYDACGVHINGYEGENHFIDDEYSYYINSLRQKLGKSGQLFIAIDACHSAGMDRDLDSDSIDTTLAVRGTEDAFRFRTAPRVQIPKPVKLEDGDGAEVIIVSACKEDERNYEYKTATGKMYGSLSYCISRLLKSDADFGNWADYFRKESYRGRKIFQRSQHPTIKNIK